MSKKYRLIRGKNGRVSCVDERGRDAGLDKCITVTPGEGGVQVRFNEGACAIDKEAKRLIVNAPSTQYVFEAPMEVDASPAEDSHTGRAPTSRRRRRR